MLLPRGFLKEGVAYQYHQLLGSYFIVKQAWADNFLKKAYLLDCLIFKSIFLFLTIS